MQRNLLGPPHQDSWNIIEEEAERMEELQDCGEDHDMPSSGHSIAVIIMNSQQLNKIYTRFDS